MATQEVCSTGGSVRLYQSGELVGEACWCMEVRIQRKCEAVGEVAQRRLYRRYVCLQEVCACIGECGYRRGVLLVTEDGCTCTKSVVRRYEIIQEVCSYTGSACLCRGCALVQDG